MWYEWEFRSVFAKATKKFAWKRRLANFTTLTKGRSRYSMVDINITFNTICKDVLLVERSYKVSSSLYRYCFMNCKIHTHTHTETSSCSSAISYAFTHALAHAGARQTALTGAKNGKLLAVKWDKEPLRPMLIFHSFKLINLRGKSRVELLPRARVDESAFQRICSCLAMITFGTEKDRKFLVFTSHFRIYCN